MINEAIILAGGLGTRLKPLLKDQPKSMALIGTRPFLEYLLDYLIKNGIQRVVIAAGYMHETILSHFGNSYKELSILYSIEKEPLGTGGAILKATDNIFGDTCFILNGDTYFNVDLSSFESSFTEMRPSLSIALKPMKHFERYGTVVIDKNRIISFNEKQFCDDGLINGGIYLVDNKWLRESAPGEKFSFEKDIMEKYVGKTDIMYFISDTYFIDIGIPEDLKRANEELLRF